MCIDWLNKVTVQHVLNIEINFLFLSIVFNWYILCKIFWNGLKYCLTQNFHWHYSQLAYQLKDNHELFLTSSIYCNLQSILEIKVKDTRFAYWFFCTFNFMVQTLLLLTLEHLIVQIEINLRIKWRTVERYDRGFNGSYK